MTEPNHIRMLKQARWNNPQTEVISEISIVDAAIIEAMIRSFIEKGENRRAVEKLFFRRYDKKLSWGRK